MLGAVSGGPARVGIGVGGEERDVLGVGHGLPAEGRRAGASGMVGWNWIGAGAGGREQGHGRAGGLVVVVVGSPAGGWEVREKDACAGRENGASVPEERMNRHSDQGLGGLSHGLWIPRPLVGAAAPRAPQDPRGRAGLGMEASGTETAIA